MGARNNTVGVALLASGLLVGCGDPKLEAAGAHVTESFVSGRGHEYPDADTNALYFDWLAVVIGDD